MQKYLETHALFLHNTHFQHELFEFPKYNEEPVWIFSPFQFIHKVQFSWTREFQVSSWKRKWHFRKKLSVL